LRRYRAVAMCCCGLWAGRVMTAPLLAFAQPECRYDSPVTGEPITSWAARRNDLAKHNCRPYDPEQKTDYQRRIKEADASLDKSIDEHVERTVEKMDTKTRGKLYSDLVDKHLDVDYVRSAKGE
jgi:hypothetical protein